MGEEQPMNATTDAGAADFLPRQRTKRALEAAVQSCRGCGLYRHATQAVFGEGLKRARLMLVGEMPGNDEDLAGAPFVGPAGRLLDKALDQAGIDRADAWVTNVVKHFKWEPRGKRRLHKRPNAREVNACRPWFDAELELVKPKVVVCLGATAAQALLGSRFRVSRERGRFVPSHLAPYVTATGHPSAVLRARDSAARERLMQELVGDLVRVGRVLGT
jgi:uracil-DNA glycosylase